MNFGRGRLILHVVLVLPRSALLLWIVVIPSLSAFRLTFRNTLSMRVDV